MHQWYCNEKQLRGSLKSALISYVREILDVILTRTIVKALGGFPERNVRYWVTAFSVVEAMAQQLKQTSALKQFVGNEVNYCATIFMAGM